ncbi:zinc ABC transporter substrate-binding protein [Peptoniphilus sp. GNH]|nr:ABC transporter, substrate-binding protein [Clostridiales bacterium KA00134]UHR03504.1 zinc ABC transporter substrate-binding protein [Peptoniphilus sp. GNH]
MNLKKCLLTIFLCLFALTGCGSESADSDKPLVYTSFFPVHDMVSMIAGDTLNVKSFMPLDKEPHLWEPSAKDMKRLSKADLLVVNGANMEPWLDTVKENLPNLDILTLSDSVDLITYKGAAAIGDFQYMARLDLDKGVHEIEFGHTHENLMRVCFFKDDGSDLKNLVAKGKKMMEQKGKLIAQNETFDVEEGIVYGIEMGHESGQVFYNIKDSGKWIFISDRISENLLPYNLLSKKNNLLADEGRLTPLMEGSSSGLDKFTYDPHSWLSVVNAKKYLNAIQDKLIEKYPKNARLYKKNKLKYVDKLTDLDAIYNEKFKKLKKRDFLVVHYAYAYLARDFGLVQYPLQGLTSVESPSLKTIKKAIDFANVKGIKTVFYEYGKPAKEAQALAEEIGGQISPLASMEYVTAEQKKNKMGYIELMEMNIKNLYDSLAE